MNVIFNISEKYSYITSNKKQNYDIAYIVFVMDGFVIQNFFLAVLFVS